MVSRLTRFILLKAGLTVPMLFLLIVFVFLIMRVLPGDPALALIGEHATEAQLAAVRHRYGLDLPLSTQFLNYLGQLLTGNLGYTVLGDKTVQETILAALPDTLELTIAGVTLGALMGIGLGMISSRGWSKKIAGAGYLGTQLGLSMPVFWFGLILQLVLSVWLKVLPATGLIGNHAPTPITGIYVLDSILTANFAALYDSLLHLILPAITMGIVIMAPISAMTRANFIKFSQEDFILTQKAAGLPRSRVEYKYTLKNALLPVVTLIGLQFAGLISGAVIVENIFNIPGIGSLLVNAVYDRDFNVVQGSVIYIGVLVALTSLAIDIVYSLIDPRVKY